MKRALVQIAVALLLITAVDRRSEAGDEDSRAQAKALLVKAANDYDLGNYDDAISGWSQSYKIFPDQRILFNLGQAHRKKAEYAKALEFYRLYLANVRDAPNRRDVEDLVKELERLISQQSATTARPPLGAISSSQRLQEPRTYVEEERPWYGNTMGWAVVSAGALAVGGGVWLFSSASSLEDRVATASDTELPGLRSDISTRRTLATLTTVAGGLAIVGGLAVFILTPKTETRRIISDDVKLSLGPGSFNLSGRF